MMRRWVAVVAPVLVITAACSSGGGEEERAQTVEPTTTTASPAATTTTTTVSLDPSTITQEQLQSTLLTLDDMPPGFSPMASDPSDDSSLCDGHDPGSEVPELLKTEAQFAQNPNTGPVIGSAAATYASEDEAARFMEALLAGAQACPGPFPAPADDGTMISIAPLSFDAYGDETIALRFTFEGGLLPVTADVIYVRSGPALFQIGEITTVGGADIEQLQALVETQLERTDALVGA